MSVSKLNFVLIPVLIIYFSIVYKMLLISLVLVFISVSSSFSYSLHAFGDDVVLDNSVDLNGWSANLLCNYRDNSDEFSSSNCGVSSGGGSGETGFWSPCRNPSCTLTYSYKDNYPVPKSIEIRSYMTPDVSGVSHPKIEIAYTNVDGVRITETIVGDTAQWRMDKFIIESIKPGTSLTVKQSSQYGDGNNFAMIDRVIMEVNVDGLTPPTTIKPDLSYLIYSENVTNWGEWDTKVDRCPMGSYVQGFQIKCEAQLGPLIDDTTMNGLMLFCGDPADDTTPTVSSLVGPWGKWRNTYRCSFGGYVTGFQLRVEKPGLDDETATNNVRIYCSENEAPIEGDGDNFGLWREIHTCGLNEAVCGIKTQVQPDRGALLDDTALNNIAFLCCPLD